MTITSLDPIRCTEQNASVQVSQEKIPLTALPKLVWVGGALLVTNLVIGFGMLITPNLDIDPFGAEVQSYDAASSKISPFTEVVDTSRHQVRLAAKARPVVFVPSPEEVYASLDLPASTPRSAELNLPRTSSRQLDLPRTSSRELDIRRASVRELSIPRATRAYEQLNLPVRTENAVYRTSERTAVPASAVDVAPRRASEREKNFVVIN